MGLYHGTASNAEIIADINKWWDNHSITSTQYAYFDRHYGGIDSYLTSQWARLVPETAVTAPTTQMSTTTYRSYSYDYYDYYTPVRRIKRPKPTPPNITSLPKPVKEQLIDVQKYEYTTGLCEINAGQIGYARTGIYVSKPFNIPGNPVEVTLQSYERHPLFDAAGEVTQRHTSIEYSIAYKDKPTQSDWLPILPKMQTVVYNELLLLSSKRIAELRMKARPDRPIKVYRDNVELPQTDWHIYPDYQQVIISNDFSASHTYSIDYTPDETYYNPWTVDLLSAGMSTTTVTEYPDAPDRNGTLYLEHYPYIDYAKLDSGTYHPIKLSLYDATIVGPDDSTFNSALPWHESTVISTRNMTDYVNDRRPALAAYDYDDLQFQYTQLGNMLQLAETFDQVDPTSTPPRHATGKFKVQYDVLAPSVRFKVIMRNMSTTLATTPILLGYTLNFHIVR